MMFDAFSTPKRNGLAYIRSSIMIGTTLNLDAQIHEERHLGASDRHHDQSLLCSGCCVVVGNLLLIIGDGYGVYSYIR
jgi:hypothetical protein